MKKLLLLILVVITIVFGVYLLRQTLFVPSTNNSVTRTVTSENPAPSVNLRLSPETIEAVSGETFQIDILIPAVSSDITALDILLKGDITTVEFLSVDNLNKDYLNPRHLVDDNTFVFSFVKKLNSQPLLNGFTLATLTFKALNPGTVTLTPLINTSSARSSLLYLEDSLTNALKSINPVTVTIK